MADPAAVIAVRSGQHPSLLEFQQQLARRLQQTGDTRRVPQDCIAACSGSRHWLFDLAFTAEVVVMPLPENVPFTQPWYLGLIHHRGELFGVIDLEQFAGAPARPRNDTDRLLLLSPTLPVRCGFRLSRLSGIVDRSAMRSTGRDRSLPDWSPVSFESGDGIAYSWIDIDALIRDPAFIGIGRR